MTDPAPAPRPEDSACPASTDPPSHAAGAGEPLRPDGPAPATDPRRSPGKDPAGVAESPGGSRRILLVTASVGAGHNSAAKALAEQLRRDRPGDEVQILDVLDYVPRAFRAVYAGGFAVAMARFPRLYGLGFCLSNRPQRPRRGLLERVKLFTERLATRRFVPHVLDAQPDVIIHTHFLAPPVLARCARRGRLAAPQVVVVTDIAVHRFWHSEGVAHWFLPQPVSAPPLLRWGVPAEQLTITGLPIHPKWHEPLDREQIRRDWDIPDDRRVILLSGGTEFTVGPITTLARRLAGAHPDCLVFVLAGRNKPLLARLSRLAETGLGVRPVGFTDRNHELVEISEFMITKAGGVSTAECVARRTPLILWRPVPGQEGGNARFLREQGAAEIARSSKQMLEIAARWLADADILAARQTGCAQSARPGAPAIIARLTPWL
jgi:processive 1,2-diacylglycerol beta-glucosyltransferase